MLTDDDATKLADMWGETATLFEKRPFSYECGTIASIYRECANDLRLLSSGDKSPIEVLK